MILPYQIRGNKWVELLDGRKMYIADIDYKGNRNPTQHFAVYLVPKQGASDGEWTSPEKISRMIGKGPYNNPVDNTVDLGIASWSQMPNKTLNEEKYSKENWIAVGGKPFEWESLDHKAQSMAKEMVGKSFRLRRRGTNSVQLVKCEACEPCALAVSRSGRRVSVQFKLTVSGPYGKDVVYMSELPKDSIIEGKKGYCKTCRKWKSVNSTGLCTSCSLGEDINIPVKKGDTVLVGKFKNKPIKVTNIGKDDHDMPTINNRKAVTFRFPKIKSLTEIMYTEGIAQKKGLTKADVDQEQFKAGLEVEKEHTNDPKRLEQTVLDHLAEDPQYYTKLKKAGLEETEIDPRRFQKKSGVFNCVSCGKSTRSTGRKDNENVQMCVKCYDKMEKQNKEIDDIKEFNTVDSGWVIKSPEGRYWSRFAQRWSPSITQATVYDDKDKASREAKLMNGKLVAFFDDMMNEYSHSEPPHSEPGGCECEHISHEEFCQNPATSHVQTSYGRYWMCDSCKKNHQMKNEVSPPGWSGTVKAMKKHKNIDNPFALAWSMKKKGYKPHHKPEKKRESLSLTKIMKESEEGVGNE